MLFDPERIILAVYTGSRQLPPKDRLSSTLWWRLAVYNQSQLTSATQYDVCLFGDSILAQVGNSFGDRIFNFSLNGLSTISLVEQLKILTRAQVSCYQAIVAIGTNDAWYDMSDKKFIEMLTQTVVLLRLMQAKHIVLVPALYSTVAASLDPKKAGSIKRVDEINALIHKVAVAENVTVEREAIQELCSERSLKENLTTDGVHLNREGVEIYRQALLKLLSKNT